MNSADILSLLEQLDDEVDDLEEAIGPLIKTTLAESAPKLPLLDKAKLYALVTYAIESLLFSYLRLNGVNAREHPVFQELSRVKQYFDKIKNAEFPPEKGNTQTLDKKAAARFIKAGLSGNDKYDLARAEQQAKERARAQIIGEGLSKKRDIEQVDKAGEEHGESDSDSSSVEEQGDESKPKKPKRRKIDTTSAQESTQESTEGHPSLTGISKRASRKARRAQERRDRKEAKEAAKKAARDYVEETSNEIAKEAGA